MPNTLDDAGLMAAARTAREHAYAPYSAFSVGAALLCDDGTVVAGCNVENASYGMTLCAERNAVAAAVALGRRKYTAIAVAGPDDAAATPCGACLQVLSEFAPGLRIVYGRPEGVVETSLDKLLPVTFELP